MKLVKIYLLFSLPLVLPYLSLQAQSEISRKYRNGIKTSVGLQQGWVINLPGKARYKGGAFSPIPTSSYYFGLDLQFLYKQKWKISLGYVRSSYTVGLDYIDSQLYANRFDNIGWGGGTQFAGDYSRYTYAPLKIGYIVSKPSRRFQFCPFVEVGRLHTRKAGMQYSSTSTGVSKKPTDTMYTSVTIAAAKPYKQAYTLGGGFELLYNFRRWYVAMNVEYFRSNKIWTTLKGTYSRSSIKYGTYSDYNIIDSRGASIFWGLTFYYRLNPDL